MSDPSIVHGDFVIERRYPVPPERVFRALSDPALKRRWFADGGAHELDAFEMDFRVGGREITRSRLGPDTPFPGVALENDASFLDIVPGQRVVMASTMSIGGRRMSAHLVSFEVLATATGAELIFTHHGAFFENADGPERREHGWRVLFARLDAELAA